MKVEITSCTIFFNTKNKIKIKGKKKQKNKKENPHLQKQNKKHQIRNPGKQSNCSQASITFKSFFSHGKTNDDVPIVKPIFALSATDEQTHIQNNMSRILSKTLQQKKTKPFERQKPFCYLFL